MQLLALLPCTLNNHTNHNVSGTSKSTGNVS